MKLQPVNCQYGAPMGRRNVISSTDRPVKFHLQRVRLDSGGYDTGGAYWGTGSPLYRARSDEGEEYFTRAAGRDEAKTRVRQWWPAATFWR